MKPLSKAVADLALMVLGGSLVQVLTRVVFGAAVLLAFFIGQRQGQRSERHELAAIYADGDGGADVARRPSPGFEPALRQHLEAIPKLKRTRGHKKLIEILDWPEGERRDRALARLEAHAAAVVGEPVGTIDWQRRRIDWALVIRVLIVIVSIVLLFAGEPGCWSIC